MSGRRTLCLSVFVLASALLAGCHAAKAPKIIKIALVANSDAAAAEVRQGLAVCRRVTPVEIAEFSLDEDAAPDQRFALAATENADLVFGLGYPVVDGLAATARRFPAVHFALIDAVVNEENVDSLTFDESQGAFMAGALAALVSKTHTVAFLGGADVDLLQRSEVGFTAGAHFVDPRTRVDARYLGSFTDRLGGRQLAARMFDAGDDVVYVVAGQAGLGAIDAVKTRSGRFVIGADANQDGLAPGKVLTSVIKRYDVAAERVCTEAVAQKPVSGHVVLGLADHGISLSDMRYTRGMIGAGSLARLARIRAAIVAGTLHPPATRAELATFKPAAIR
jgi:basic membrane protein A